MIAALIPALAPIVGKVLDSVLPNTAERDRAKAEVMNQMLAHSQELEQAAAGIIKTEAASSHWLAANWRPMLMVTFGGLIVARWFGWAAPELSTSEYLKLWDIVELGLGGYVIGRSAEKIIPRVAETLKRK